MQTPGVGDLLFAAFVSAVGFLGALTGKKRSVDRGELFAELSRFVKVGGWLLGVGGLLISIEILLIMFGVISG